MIEHGNPQEVEEYFADESVNQSYLKQLIKGVDFLEEKEEILYFKEKGHFIIGSAVDVYITQGIVNFNEQYYTSEGSKPSDTIMSMVKMVFDNTLLEDNEPTNLMLEQVSVSILEALNFHKYQARWKEETRILKVIEEGKDYFEELKQSHGKKILSAKESELVHHIIMSLQSGKYTSEYFKEDQDTDIYYQVPVYFTYKELPCKILIDMLRINRRTLTIEPIDLKTMAGNTVEFPWAVKSRGYHFQGAFYNIGLKELISGRGMSPRKLCKDLPTNSFSGYKLKAFKFIVETTKTEENKLTDEVRYFTGKPLVFQLSHALEELGRRGRPELFVMAETEENSSKYVLDYKKIVGIDEAIELHKWHLENGFSEDKEVILNEGIIELL